MVGAVESDSRGTWSPGSQPLHKEKLSRVSPLLLENFSPKGCMFGRSGAASNGVLTVDFAMVSVPVGRSSRRRSGLSPVLQIAPPRDNAPRRASDLQTGPSTTSDPSLARRAGSCVGPTRGGFPACSWKAVLGSQNFAHDCWATPSRDEQAARVPDLRAGPTLASRRRGREVPGHSCTSISPRRWGTLVEGIPDSPLPAPPNAGHSLQDLDTPSRTQSNMCNSAQSV